MTSSKDTHEAYIFARPGLPSDVLRLSRDHTTPELRDDEILVKVTAAALNPVDWKLMQLVPKFIGKRPALTGCDYSGEILKSQSSRFNVGDRVFGMVGSKLNVTRGLGTLSQVIAAPAETCAKIPTGISETSAAAAPLVGLTALAMAKAAADVPIADERQRQVLVCGGSTSVGLSLIPILRHRGYKVAATCSAAKADAIKKRGAHLTFDYRSDDVVRKIRDHCRDTGPFDAILDCADSFSLWQQGAELLTKEGVFMNIGVDLSAGVIAAAIRLMSYYLRPAALGGVPRRYTRPAGFGTKDRIEELAGLLEQGILVPVIDSEHEWTEVQAAFERLRSNRATGKVIVKVAA